jgi:predicted phosphate transport protein (TIGR00153 family)
VAKRNYSYFEQFEKQIQFCEKAAEQLVAMLEDYTDVQIKAERIHDTEHNADEQLHELMQELNRSFVTPIDREDIVHLANALDDITDAIEDVANLLDVMSIETVKPEAKGMSLLIDEGCKALSELVSEFHLFKSSKKLNDLIIKVNEVEAEGDVLHRSVTKELFKNEKDAVELIKWKQIFDTMEDTLDIIEDVADMIDGLIIKNS